MTTQENTRKKILIVEDDDIGARILGAYLQEFNLHYDHVTSGKAALKKINKSYSAVFLDIGLPDISGFDLARAIRQSPRAYKSTTLIGMSAHFSEKQDKNNELSMMDAFFPKPLNMSALKKYLFRQ